MDASKANQASNSKKEAAEDVKTDDLPVAEISLCGSNNTTNNTPTPPTDLEDSLRTVVIVDSKEENEPTSSVVAEKEEIEPEPMQPTEAIAEKEIESAKKDKLEPIELVEPVAPETEGVPAPEVAEITGEKCIQDKHINGVKDENGFVYYKCRFCGLTFNFMTTLKAHERVHDVMQPYLCNKCGEAFHFMCELEYHAKQHLKQKGYKCDCGRTFYQYTDLLYHRHPGEDGEPVSVPMPADPAPPVIPSPSMPAIDPASFPTPDFMEKGVYSDIRSKPYICQYCSKSYSDSRGLANHMYSHRGERMFNPRSSRYLMCRNENSYMSPGADV
uniref:Zinc finger protein unc-98 n=1 Tax=Ditylenchus dipsaci TaxID=166011 RepID=A0A915D5Q1_9BILA